MNEFDRLIDVYSDGRPLDHEQVRRARRTGPPRGRTTRSALAARLHRLADRLDG